MEKEVLTRNKTKRVLLRIGLGILGLVTLILLLIAFVINIVVTPEKITPVLLNMSKEYIRGEVNCESVDITFFSTFPDLGVQLKHGNISSETDTLLNFDRFTVVVDPGAFLFRQQIIIHQLELENAELYAHVDTTGKANWDIFVATNDTITGSLQDTAAFVMPELNVNNIRLRNVQLVYDDWQKDIFVMVDTLHLRLKGDLSKEQAQLSLGIRAAGITSYYQGETFTRMLPFSFRTTLVRDRLAKSLTLERGTVTAGSLELKTNGILQQHPETGIADVDVDFTLGASSLTDVVRMIPEHLSSVPSRLVAGGKITSGGKLSGQLGEGHYPVVTLEMQLTEGSLALAKYPEKPFIEKIELDFSTLVDFSGAQSSSVELRNLYMQTADSRLTLRGGCDQLLTHPLVYVQAKADVDFTEMSKKLPLDSMEAGGQVDFDITAQCLLNDLLAEDYGKIDAHGVVNIREVKFKDVEEQFDFYTSRANMTLGTHTRDSIGERVFESLLRSKIVLDTLNLNWKDELVANSSRVSVLLTTSEPQDSASIAPVMIGSRVSNMRLVMGDSIRLRGVQLLGGINIRPRVDMPGLPEISGSVTMDTIRGRVYEMGGRLSQATLKLKFVRQASRQRNNRTGNRAAGDSTLIAPRGTFAGRDSTLTRAQRDSLRRMQQDPTTNISFRIESQEVKELLRNWEISGGLSSRDIRVRTPYFPLPVQMSEAEMTFTDNTLNLNKAHVFLGSSDFSLKGDVEGIRRALLYNAKVTAKMTLDADSLDFNELIRTAVAGSEYSSTSGVERDSISGAILDEGHTLTSTEDTTALGIFVVPRNLDVEFNSRIRNGKFGNVNIRNVRGRIILRDQAIQLPRLMLNTDVGSAMVTMVYKAPDPDGAYLGLELGMKQIDLKELIEGMPVIVEMAPMIRSFEGVVDCNITAVTELDSLMNVRLTETSASCYLSGQELVLLDGETFAEISKMLMFKNKKRNVIDSISVEMILEEEKLMIFPFQVSMDRYNAAVGGIQNLDLSFDYHITVLKSPVPFKLGLNISGTPDKMKIRLGKAKYKDMFTVARQKDLENTTINLRQEMDEKLRQSIQEIAGMELRQPMRRPRMEIPDSLRQHLFQLEDTVATSPVVVPERQTEEENR